MRCCAREDDSEYSFIADAMTIRLSGNDSAHALEECYRCLYLEVMARRYKQVHYYSGIYRVSEKSRQTFQKFSNKPVLRGQVSMHFLNRSIALSRRYSDFIDCFSIQWIGRQSEKSQSAKKKEI